MSVQKLIQAKGAFVSVASSHVTVDHVISQLEADDVSAIVVSDDNQNIRGIISGIASSRVLRRALTVARECVTETARVRTPRNALAQIAQHPALGVSA
jgi:hypothetical protein